MTSHAVLGLKAGQDLFDSSDGSFDVFESGSESLMQISPNLDQPQFEANKNSELSLPKIQNKSIVSFDDAFRQITKILSFLESNQMIKNGDDNAKSNDDDFYFVPEQIVSDDFSQALNAYINSDDKDAKFSPLINDDLSNLHNCVLAQICLVDFAKGKNVDLKKFDDEHLDSQVLSLIYFALSKNQSKNVACFYLIQSLFELSKCNKIPPIAKLFPDYTLRNLFHLIALNLVDLFPHNPLLPSVIHKFSLYDPSAIDVLDLIPDEESDSDFDFSDSFFDSIKQVQQENPIIKLPIFSNENVINPLENCQQTISNALTVMLNEPPSMITFKMKDGSIQLTPNLFTDWIASLAPESDKKKKVLGFIPVSTKKAFAALTLSSPVLLKDLSNDLKKPEATKETLLNILAYEKNSDKIQFVLPAVKDPLLFTIHFPIIQIINSKSKAPFFNDFLYPSIIKMEHVLHNAIVNNNTTIIEKVLKKIVKNIEDPVPDIEIKPFPNELKRDFPKWDEAPTDLIIKVTKLSDIEFVLNGRSPLTLNRVLPRDPLIRLSLDQEQRSKFLYYYYTNYQFPPYITLRLAFALAINLNSGSGKMLSFTSNILFESIHGISQSLPELLQTECVRMSILYFADILDSLDCYYYSALLLDSFYLGDPTPLTSNQIANFCQRRNDISRTLFHFSEVLKLFTLTDKTEEALYISQIITSIYHDYGLPKNSIVLLSYLLGNSYHISIKRFIKPSNSSIASPSNTWNADDLKYLSKLATNFNYSKLNLNDMPPTINIDNSNLNNTQFTPNPTSANTIISGISLVDLLIKNRYFKMADNLLHSLIKNADMRIYNSLINFFSLKLKLNKNLFYSFLSKIPPIVIQIKRNSTGSRLSFRSATNFDSNIAIMKLLLDGFLYRSYFSQTIFWAEIIINTQNKLILKDLGRAFLNRGMAFLNALSQARSTLFPFSFEIPLSPLMAQVGEFLPQNCIYKKRSNIVSEAVSSFKCAAIYYEKLGCIRKVCFATLLYANTILTYFLDDNIYTNNINLNDLSRNSQIDPLCIRQPQLITKPKVIPQYQNIKLFESFAITHENVEEQINSIIQAQQKIINKMMHPYIIIFNEIVEARFQLFLGQIIKSKQYYDFAFNNIKQFFACGPYFIQQNTLISELFKIQTIMESMCSLLFQFEPDFINNHLCVFDWVIGLKNCINDSLRNISSENKELIESRICLSKSSLYSTHNSQFPDFLGTVEKSEVVISNQIEEETISSLLLKIKSNIRLFELEKIKEDEMQERNRELCQKMKSVAEEYRSEHSYMVPADTNFDFIKKASPKVLRTIFMVTIGDFILIYQPSSGNKRCIQMKCSSNKTSFSISTKAHDIKFSTVSETFHPLFVEFLINFLIIDKNVKKSTLKPENINKYLKATKKLLFKDFIKNLEESKWKINPDNSSFFTRSSKGSLFTVSSPPPPIIFITDSCSSIFPFEMMFSEYFVLRSLNFCHICYYRSNINAQAQSNKELSIPKIVFYRRGKESNIDISIQRSVSLANYFISSLGGSFSSIQYVKKDERKYNYFLPCFQDNKDNSYYNQKYPFCTFIDTSEFNFVLTPKRSRKSKSSKPQTPSQDYLAFKVYLMTYTDLCENHLMLQKLTSFKQAAFLFIPAFLMKNALVLMKPIFERHKKRIAFFQDTKNINNDIGNDKRLALNPIDFIISLQTTLISSLHCPIPLIIPA